MPTPKLQFPKSADNDIPELANELITAIARAMLDDGQSATAITYMRRSVITSICEFYPWAYRAKRPITLVN